MVPDPDRVAEAVVACPSVAGLAGDAATEVATYLPGRRVAGVRVRDDGVEVSVVARWGRPLHDVAAEVRKALLPLVGGLPIVVRIDDIEVPEVRSLSAQAST